MDELEEAFTVLEKDIPFGLLTFIYDQPVKFGRIKASNLPKEYLSRGIVECQYEFADDRVVLSCFKEKR